MASSDLYSALAALTPQFDTDVTINVRWPNSGGSSDAMANTLHESDAPMRILGLPERVGVGNNMEFAWIALGTSHKVTHTIQDRLWVLPAEMDQKLIYNSPKLIRYVDSYNTQITNNRGLTSQSHIVSVTYRYGWNYWPEIGGTSWFTLDALVTLEEFAAT